MPAMVPATSERNLTPSSTAPRSPPSTIAGIGLDGQIMKLPWVTVMLRGLVTLPPAEEVNWTVKFDVRAVVGVPEMTATPAPDERSSPSGNVPLAIDHAHPARGPEVGLGRAARGRVAGGAAIGRHFHVAHLAAHVAGRARDGDPLDHGGSGRAQGRDPRLRSLCSTSGTESRTSPIRFFDLANSQIDGTTALPEGKVNLKTEYSAAGPMDQGGTLRLFVNGKPAGEGKIHWRLSGKSGGNGFALVLDPGRRAAYRRSVRTLVILLATAGGVGYVPIASGTFGSMVAVPFLPGLAALRSGAPLAYAAIVAVVIAVAIWSAGRAEGIFGGKGHARLVVDGV